jgi:probable F420-dependent oxidoreductase
MNLGQVGVWWSWNWEVDGDDSADALAELESLGYGAIWSSGAFTPQLSRRFADVLGSTNQLVVASGIVSIWVQPAHALAAEVAELEAKHPGRFLLGLGASHSASVENYNHPYTHMVEFLDSIDAADHPVPKERRVLAALRPRMMELAGRRSAGAHPYFVPVAHSARARQTLGPGPLLAPEVTVLIETDPSKARERARAFTTHYLGRPNYANNLRSLGYTEEDLVGGGSDRLVDDIVAWGDLDAVAHRVREHHQAGADHVCIQVLGPTDRFPLAEYRELASALLSDTQSG